MATQASAGKSDRSTSEGPNTPGGVSVSRIPIALARHLYQIFVAAAADPLAQAGLTTLQFGAMVYLSRITGEPDIDQNSLAARLCIDRASMSQIVGELETMGLVERRVNGADRRARLLRLTPRGERLRARLRPEQWNLQMQVLAALAPDERELFLDLLVRIIEANRDLARPGAGRRKPGIRRPSADKSRSSSSTKA